MTLPRPCSASEQKTSEGNSVVYLTKELQERLWIEMHVTFVGNKNIYLRQRYDRYVVNNLIITVQNYTVYSQRKKGEGNIGDWHTKYQESVRYSNDRTTHLRGSSFDYP